MRESRLGQSFYRLRQNLAWVKLKPSSILHMQNCKGEVLEEPEVLVPFAGMHSSKILSTPAVRGAQKGKILLSCYLGASFQKKARCS